MFFDTKKVEIELGAFSTLDTLLDELINASRATAHRLGPNKTELDWKKNLVMGILGDHMQHWDGS